MNIDACYQLGYITKPHGVNGEVVAVFDVDFPENYKKLESVFIQINKKLVPFFIEKISISKEKCIIKFEDVNSYEQAEPLQSGELYLPLEKLPQLPENQFYFHEIIGFQIVDDQLGNLGKVENYYQLGTHDVLAMQYKDTEVLIPVTDEIIIRVDRPNQILHTNLPDGLLDVYLNPSDEEKDD